MKNWDQSPSMQLHEVIKKEINIDQCNDAIVIGYCWNAKRNFQKWNESVDYSLHYLGLYVTQHQLEHTERKEAGSDTSEHH